VATGTSLARNGQPLLHTTNLSSLCSDSAYYDCGNDEKYSNVIESHFVSRGDLTLLVEKTATVTASLQLQFSLYGGIAAQPECPCFARHFGPGPRM
jgi:hypothetical protein